MFKKAYGPRFNSDIDGNDTDPQNGKQWEKQK